MRDVVGQQQRQGQPQRGCRPHRATDAILELSHVVQRCAQPHHHAPVMQSWNGLGHILHFLFGRFAGTQVSANRTFPRGPDLRAVCLIRQPRKILHPHLRIPHHLPGAVNNRRTSVQPPADPVHDLIYGSRSRGLFPLACKIVSGRPDLIRECVPALRQQDIPNRTGQVHMYGRHGHCDNRHADQHQPPMKSHLTRLPPANPLYSSRNHSACFVIKTPISSPLNAKDILSPPR